MGKFRIKKEKLEATLNGAIADNLYIPEDFAKRHSMSISYVGDLFAEIRRALKRGDMTTTPEAMEHFLRTSKREAKTLDKISVKP